MLVAINLTQIYMPHPMKKAIATAMFFAVSTLLSATSASKVEAKTAKCYLSVNGTIYINGSCRFKFENGDGSFSFDDMKMRTKCLSYDLGSRECSMASTGIIQKGTFGQLVITSPGRAKIYWNEGVALHGQSEISPVTKNGACWQNSKAKLCAW